jgi:hypothetical protein
MILGLSTATFIQVHVVLSMVAIGTGLIVLFGLLTARRLPVSTALFLSTTALTSLTGFLFPYHGMTPGIEVGLLSMVILLLAAIARYSRGLAGAWRHTYIVSAMIALYLNVVILVVQIFSKLPPLTARTPKQFGILFKLTELAVLAAFVVATHFALKRFRGTHIHRV